MTTVKVFGLKELEQKLKALADEFGQKKAKSTLRSALRKAGVVVQKEAQRRVHVDKRKPDDGVHVRDNIIVTSAKKTPPNVVAVNVTVRTRSKKYVNNAKNRRAGRVGGAYRDMGRLYYAKFLEFGTSKMPAYPFMRPAFEAKKGELPGIIRDELALAIDRAVKRLRSR